MLICFYFSLTEPDKVSSLSLSTPENNEIKVTCGHPTNLRGPDMKFRARLYAGGYPQGPLKEVEKKCEFEFKDLSYLTTYRVEVCIIHIFGDTK